MSLYKEGDKLNKFLFVFLVLQIIVLCLLNTTIAIPVAMAKSLSENHEALCLMAMHHECESHIISDL